MATYWLQHLSEHYGMIPAGDRRAYDELRDDPFLKLALDVVISVL